MRRSPGSPSQMIAALLRRAVRTCRSRQLTLTLSWPPTNHFAYGGCQSSTRVHGVIHSSSRGKAGPELLGIGRRALVDVRIGDARAFTPLGGGANTRASFSRASISGHRYYVLGLYYVYVQASGGTSQNARIRNRYSRSPVHRQTRSVPGWLTAAASSGRTPARAAHRASRRPHRPADI